MSLSEAKKLEDLKEHANKLNDAFYANVGTLRIRAIESVLKGMTDYLVEQGFDVQSKQAPARSFVAIYKDINISAETSKDDENFIGADYHITVSKGKSKTQFSLIVKRGKRVTPPMGHGTVSQQISDYETRYIPQLEARDPSEIDGSFMLYVIEESRSGKSKIDLASGKEVIDYLFKK